MKTKAVTLHRLEALARALEATQRERLEAGAEAYAAAYGRLSGEVELLLAHAGIEHEPDPLESELGA